ncbi:MAG: [FeFe] hydrogenase H-cluster radical SAM maturase HydE [Chitinispirillaceae bacterium]
MSITEVLHRNVLERDDLVDILGCSDSAEMEQVRSKAEKVLLENCGNEVFYRGLIEFSNVCASDCLYCGIRKSNDEVERYTLSKEEMVSAAQWCARQGYGSLVLQSGERRDRTFVDLVESTVREIKAVTVSETLPKGLGITLCCGEQESQVYKRWYDAGAHRYLLRIETSDPALFSAIHPPSQKLENRTECLKELKKIGYQVGTGVMIGFPGQSVENLADDILFFRKMDVDMIGMGPYIVHPNTPMHSHINFFNENREEIFGKSLLMIAATRLALKDVNIAATTALQTMKQDGREQGLTHGANVIMPQLTPMKVRKNYLLYEGKPCLDENAEQCRFCLQNRIHSVDRVVGLNKWGDSRHWARRNLSEKGEGNIGY